MRHICFEGRYDNVLFFRIPDLGRMDLILERLCCRDCFTCHELGVAKWTRVRLRGRLDGLCGESGILCLSMVGSAGEGLMVVTVHIFSNSSTWRVSRAT